jgi:hypothetical protein
MWFCARASSCAVSVHSCRATSASRSARATTARPAFETFYAALDDQQKARLDDIGPPRWGWRWG